MADEVDIEDALHRALRVRLRSIVRACEGIQDLLDEYTFDSEDVVKGYAVAKSADLALCELWGNVDAGCLNRADEHIARFMVDEAMEG